MTTSDDMKRMYDATQAISENVNMLLDSEYGFVLMIFRRDRSDNHDIGAVAASVDLTPSQIFDRIISGLHAWSDRHIKS